MMGRLNHDQAELFYSFHLEDTVPQDHLRGAPPVSLWLGGRRELDHQM
jgi:hypothetical protein